MMTMFSNQLGDPGSIAVPAQPETTKKKKKKNRPPKNGARGEGDPP